MSNPRTTTAEPTGKAKRRFVMSIMPEDEEDLAFIVAHYRKTSGFELKIAEVQRRVWKNEIARIKAGK